MKSIFWEIKSKNYFRFWAKQFQNLSTKLRHLWQKCLPRIQKNILKKIFFGKDLVLDFFWKVSKRTEFVAITFPQNCRKCILRIQTIFHERVCFWKKKFVQSSFSVFEWKCYGFSSTNFSCRVFIFGLWAKKFSTSLGKFSWGLWQQLPTLPEERLEGIFDFWKCVCFSNILWILGQKIVEICHNFSTKDCVNCFLKV